MSARNQQSARYQESGVSLVAGLWAVGGIVAFTLLVAASIRRIAPDEIGIRIVNVGSDKGLVKKDFDAGFYRNLWLLESWDTLPRSVQRVSFTNRVDGRGPDDQPAIEAKAKEGDRVTVEATVLFRIPDGKGHIVYQDSGKGDAFKRVARDIAGAEIPAAFATLGIEDIYDQEKRRAAYKKLEETLGAKLRDLRNLELVDVAITEVTYDPKYEALLERKKVADQKTLLEASQRKRNEEKNKKDAIVAETVSEVKRIQGDSKNEITRLNADNMREIEGVKAQATKLDGDIRAETNKYKLTNEATGSLANGQAEAYAIQQQREALGENGQNYVAYTTAQNFPVKSVVMSSVGIDWLNPASYARMLVGAAMESAPSSGSGGGTPKKDINKN